MRRSVWSDHVWPVLFGAMVADRLAGAVSGYGVKGVLLGIATLAPFGVVVFWGLSEELGINRTAVVRLGVGSAVGVLVLLGLTVLFPTYGLVIAAAVAVSSPRALGLLGGFRRRASHPAGPRTVMDPDLVDRRFDDIVRRLADPSDSPET